ncbi:hypothetical protein AAHC03_025930 [Spirometra sp. Aus1]
MRRNQRIPLVFFLQWTKNFLLAASLQTAIGQYALADLSESQQSCAQGSNNLSYLTEFDLNDDKFSVSHRLLDTVTYAFCTIGILSNFFAYALLNGKSTIGVLLIKLILLSDGLVCVFYLLNQVWTDITINYLMNSLVTEYLSRKPILQHISNVLRTLAVTTVSVSNWYIVCMILHRCVSLYANPMRGRFEKSLWVLAQKPPNLWLAFLSCWLFSLLQASLTLHRFPLVLDVLTFVLPLCLVFLSSIILLYGLRAIQRSQNSNLPAGGPHPKSFGCCGALCSPHRCGKGDLDETFAQTKVQTGTPDNGSTCTVHNSYAAASPNARENQPYNPLNSDTETRDNHELTELRRKRIYSRVTMTILSLAVSFLILDSLQFADLLIRIPWQNILGSVEDNRRQNLSWIPLPHLNITIDLMREVQMSGEKQSVLSIVKNSCTLGKTLTNFIILCAHSRHFRFLLIAHFRRLQRLLRSLQYRCCQRAQRRHLYWAVAPTCAPAFAQPNCASCDKKKRVRWRGVGGSGTSASKTSSTFSRCHLCARRRQTYGGNLLGWRTQWKRRSKRRSTNQPLSWQQGMIFYKPPPLLPTGPLKQGLLGSGDGSGDGSQPSCSGLKHILHQAEGVSFSSSGKSSDAAKCLSSTSGNGSSGCLGFSESSNSVACCAVCLHQSSSVSSNQKTTKQHEVRSVG